MFKKNSIILIVDDSDSIRKQLKADLKELGFINIVESNSGLDALTKVIEAGKEASPINLVISDLAMPTMTGLELLAELRNMETYYNLPFIMLTAEKQVDMVIKALDAGVNGYLMKPYTAEALLECLNNVYTKIRKKF